MYQVLAPLVYKTAARSRFFNNAMSSIGELCFAPVAAEPISQAAAHHVAKLFQTHVGGV
jgi:hypothetical protein